MDRLNKEQYLLERYKANMRHIENELAVLEKKERMLEEQENNLLSFKSAFREYINDASSLQGYPDGVRRLDEIAEEHKQVSNFEDDVYTEIRSVERQNQIEYETLQTEKKSLLTMEKTYTETYETDLKALRR